ncbi:MAG: hypothetical protein MZV49_01515 [Rhodopseudomonas palustris]|nr:hypothetical protein [Rhodopseudomonas palustris]
MATVGNIMASMVGLNGFELRVNADRTLTALTSVAGIATLFAIALLTRNSQQLLGYNPDAPDELKAAWGRQLPSDPRLAAALGGMFCFTLSQMSAAAVLSLFSVLIERTDDVEGPHAHRAATKGHLSGCHLHLGIHCRGLGLAHRVLRRAVAAAAHRSSATDAGLGDMVHRQPPRMAQRQSALETSRIDRGGVLGDLA